MIGEQIWLPGPRDRAGLRLDAVAGGGLSSLGGTQHTYSWTVPQDLVLCLAAVTVVATGVVATVVSLQVRIDSDSDIEAYLHLSRHTGSAEAALNRDFTHVYVTGGRRLICNALFSGVNAGNASNASFAGLLVPKGNLAVNRLQSTITVI